MDTFEQEVERVVEAAANRDALFAALEKEHADYDQKLAEEIDELNVKVAELGRKRQWAERVKAKQAQDIAAQFTDGTDGVSNYDTEPF